MSEDPVKARRRHVFLWKYTRFLTRFVTWLRFGFVGRQSDLKGPFLLVSNHNTNWDPILVHASFREQIYFVSSEHVLRSRVWGKFIRWAQDPIPRQKSGSAAGTVMAMLRRLRDGYSVCVFPEGNRSWDGVTRPFPPAIGKLARTAGVPLVTYRLIGAYFASPRWSGDSPRRGRVRGAVVRVYTPEELKAMTPAQVDGHIREDLFEDAYARQRKNPIRFEGRRLAEHLETMLFLCPKCGRLHTLTSKNDTVRCWKCGFSFRYLPTGYLAGDDLPFDELKRWYAWQEGEIRRMCAEAGESPIFTDADMTADEVFSAKGERFLGRGDVRLYRDRLELPGVTVPVSEITGMSIMGPQDLYVGTRDHNYLIRSELVRCTVKYISAISCLTGRSDLGV